MVIGYVTDKGLIREENQDSILIQDCPRFACTIFAVCDGMGGAKAGGVASAAACRTFVDYIQQKLSGRNLKSILMQELLFSAASLTNGTVYELASFVEEYNGMGSTLVGGIAFDDGRIYLINVGDSRAYRLSKRAGKLVQVTTDHSFVEELVRAGIINRNEARNHPQRNVITRAIGSEQTVDADYYEFSIRRREMLLVCTDGLHKFVTDEEIYDYFEIDPNPDDYCDTLLQLVRERGAGDNVTIAAFLKL